MTPQGANPRVIEFDTREGTDITLDASRDGHWIVFDLLGHVYRMPSKGGSAETLTSGSGIAPNVHPAISPDSRRIAFASDRSGQMNLWVMNIDGSAPQMLTSEVNARFVDPAWSPDGKTLVAVRKAPWRGYGWDRRTAEIWLVPLDGSPPKPLVRAPEYSYNAPSFSPDGKYVYFHRSFLPYGRSGGWNEADYTVQRFEIATGTTTSLTDGSPVGVRPDRAPNVFASYYEDFSRSSAPAAVEPVPSPDGRLLAFARTVRKPLEYRGHRYWRSTALYLRDLESRTERQLAWPMVNDLTEGATGQMEKLPPSIAWAPDGKTVYYVAGGGIHAVNTADGAVHNVPFTAHVRRIVSEPVRRTAKINDDHFSPKLLQWPSTSRDGKNLAFVAAGKVWTCELAACAPRALTNATAPGAFQYMPSWAPDGTELAFASWDNKERGAIWRYSIASGTSRRVTTEPGEYLYPIWSSGGKSLTFLRAEPQQGGTTLPAQFAQGNFDAAGWQLLTSSPGQTPQSFARIDTVQPVAAFGADDVSYLRFSRPGLDTETGKAWPELKPDDALLLMSVNPAQGARSELRLKLAPRQSWPQVALSPNGKWLAYELGKMVFVQKLPPPLLAGTPYIDLDPSKPLPGRIRVDREGGTFLHWRNDDVLEFVEGTRYVAYDVRNATRKEVAIPLDLARARPTGVIALKGAKIITMSGNEILARGDIVIDGARIRCVGRCDTAGADRTFDVSGKVIIPGLIDIHNHTTRLTADLPVPGDILSRLELAYGVTTRNDPATSAASLFPLADLIEVGRIAGPRTFGSAEPIHGPTGDPDGGSLYWPYDLPLDKPDDADHAVGWRTSWGASELKLYNLGRRSRYQNVISAARRYGINVTNEGKSSYEDIAFALDGASTFEHSVQSLPVYSDITRFLGLSGISYNPTLTPMTPGLGAQFYFRARADMLRDEKYRRFMPKDSIAFQIDNKLPNTRLPLEQFSFPMQAEAAKDVLAAGGRVGVGGHGEQPGLDTHWEIWALASALGPIDALRAATSSGAYVLGLEAETGSLEAGKLADLLVLDKDPTTDIQNTLSIRYVMKGGQLFRGEDLAPVWPQPKGTEP